MQITIIGTGFVGVVSAAVYASFGHQVIGLDVDPAKIEKLRHSQTPFYEPNLEQLLTEQLATGRLKFTTDYQEAISESEVIFIAVGTPSAADGQADLKFVKAATESLAPHLKENAIVVVKSTVPPGTLQIVEDIIKQHTKTKFATASVPEFLREGSAVHDTLHPDRVILGSNEDWVLDKLEELHRSLGAPVVKISPESAQMAKYAANSYLATRITFANQIADLCEKNGADIQEVIAAIGFDKRIGNHYWYPGLGYGGSCFPKDVKEIAAYSRAVGEGDNLFNKVDDLNEQRLPKVMEHFTAQVGDWQGKKVAVLGLSFKPNTDDMREAPSLKLVPALLAAGATVTGFDPKAEFPASALKQHQDKFTQVATIAEACNQADVIMLVIEWPEIVSFNFAQVRDEQRPQWLIDCRNQLKVDQVKAWGYTYIGVGR
jgi:UDPglucose 6-dehydrogenase